MKSLFIESVFGVPMEHSIPLGTRQDFHMKVFRGGGMKKVRVVFLGFMSCFRRQEQGGGKGGDRRRKEVGEPFLLFLFHVVLCFGVIYPKAYHKKAIHYYWFVTLFVFCIFLK